MNKWIRVAQISVTVITEVITMMKDEKKENHNGTLYYTRYCY